jgi:hypothetical protein
VWSIPYTTSISDVVIYNIGAFSPHPIPFDLKRPAFKSNPASQCGSTPALTTLTRCVKLETTTKQSLDSYAAVSKRTARCTSTRPQTLLTAASFPTDRTAEQKRARKKRSVTFFVIFGCFFKVASPWSLCFRLVTVSFMFYKIFEINYLNKFFFPPPSYEGEKKFMRFFMELDKTYSQVNTLDVICEKMGLIRGFWCGREYVCDPKTGEITLLGHFGVWLDGAQKIKKPVQKDVGK